MTTMDLSKHATVFDPVRLHDHRIAVVGCGAVGSAVALNLAKLGLENIILYDFDRIEPHNIPNQVLFGPDDIGNYKTSAAQDRVHQLTGARISYETVRITDAPHDTADVAHRARIPETVVFCCVDTMAARNYIFNHGRRMNCAWWSDGRMNARDIAAYGFDPMDPQQCAEYTKTLYSDNDVDDTHGGCAMTLSVGPTAWTLACHMVWQFMAHWTHQPYDNEILTRADRPRGMVVREFPRTFHRNAA